VARSGATFAAQLIKQVERKLLIVCAIATFRKTCPAPKSQRCQQATTLHDLKEEEKEGIRD